MSEKKKKNFMWPKLKKPISVTRGDDTVTNTDLYVARIMCVCTLHIAAFVSWSFCHAVMLVNVVLHW